MRHTPQKGFTLFFAILVSSLLLSIAITILNIALDEFDLSAIGRESHFAFFAADAGAECAIYWDRALLQGFATSTRSNTAPQVIRCADQDITIAPNMGTITATYAETEFTMNLGFNRCAVVTVYKNDTEVPPDGLSSTVIESRGRNACTGSPRNIVERGVIVRY